MNHASLFSGIGGFDLAAHWMGWNNVFNCDIEEFPRKVLKHHFPHAIQYADIKQTDFTIHAGQIDILSGGFPCQPFSTAGKRLGKNDERHLWPEMYRAIQEIRPKWIVGENVRGLLSWSDGMVLDEVYTDLENEGYEVESFVLPAAGINAPHKRERVWIIASDTKCISGKAENRVFSEWEPIESQPVNISGTCDVTDTDSRGWTEGDQRQHDRDSQRQVCSSESDNGDRVRSNSWTSSGNRSATNSNKIGFQRKRKPTKLEGKRFGFSNSQENQTNWLNFPTQPPICGGDDGIPRELDSITFPKWRRESIKAYGNAIVPQIAYRIFKTIDLVEKNL